MIAQEIGLRSDYAGEAREDAAETPPHLFVFGDGPDALPLVTLARTLGWTVTVVQTRARFETLARFVTADHVRTGPPARIAAQVDAAECPLAVVMTHDAAHDREALAMLLGSRARYIGLVGPRLRAEDVLASLDRTGPSLRGPIGRGRIHAPAGLAIGAETPAEIALAILAEAKAVLSGGSSGSSASSPYLGDWSSCDDRQTEISAASEPLLAVDA
jgi:xanthine/CO dehydrogenase XdhC/CoxF family maturation factor